jgi:pimeloyl-ACP methyl ester carboxylesterase
VSASCNVVNEVTIDIGPMTLRGKRWGDQQGLPVIALHGWLDNCASFDFVAPMLNVDLLALDLAGQGQSDHRSGLAAYNIWQDVAEVIAVADHFGWKKFGLIGHSRGAMIATLIAGTFPERVSHLALIESFVPQPLPAEDAPGQLAAAVNVLLKLKKRRNTYESFAAAVKAREHGMLKLCHQNALVLAKRGVEQDSAGLFYWNYDIKLNAPSELKFTETQLWAFVQRITIPIEVVVGEQGLMNDFEHFKPFVELTQNLTIHNLEGDHHLHMSKQCEPIAAIFNGYFNR